MDGTLDLDLQERMGCLLRMVYALFHPFPEGILQLAAFPVPLGDLGLAFDHGLYHACPCHHERQTLLDQKAEASHLVAFPSLEEIRGVAGLPSRA